MNYAEIKTAMTNAGYKASEGQTWTAADSAAFRAFSHFILGTDHSVASDIITRPTVYLAQHQKIAALAGTPVAAPVAAFANLGAAAATDESVDADDASQSQYQNEYQGQGFNGVEIPPSAPTSAAAAPQVDQSFGNAGSENQVDNSLGGQNEGDAGHDQDDNELPEDDDVQGAPDKLPGEDKPADDAGAADDAADADEEV